MADGCVVPNNKRAPTAGERRATHGGGVINKLTRPSTTHSAAAQGGDGAGVGVGGGLAVEREKGTVSFRSAQQGAGDANT